jgi:hypothetical protein
MNSVTGQEMVSILPANYDGDNIRTVLDTKGKEHDAVKEQLLFIIDQIFAASASSWGLDRWEKDLELKTDTSKPDDQRRSRVVSKLRGLGNVTVNLIKNVAESFVYGTVDVIDNPALYTFTIKFIDPLGIPANLDDVKAALEDVKPAHLAVLYEFTFTTYGDLKTWGKTYAELKAMTYGEIKTYRPA